VLVHVPAYGTDGVDEPYTRLASVKPLFELIEPVEIVPRGAEDDGIKGFPPHGIIGPIDPEGINAMRGEGRR
jgi:hypothetical protein